MAKKKKVSKKTESETPAESPGVEVAVEEAIVEEATIMVRGTAMGGTRMMTPSEHAAYCKEQAKKK